MSKVVDIYYDKKSDTYYRLKQEDSTVDSQDASNGNSKVDQPKENSGQQYVPQMSPYGQPNQYIMPMMPMMMNGYGMMPMMSGYGIPMMQGDRPIPVQGDAYVDGSGEQNLQRFVNNVRSVRQYNNDVPVEELMGEWIAPPTQEDDKK